MTDTEQILTEAADWRRAGRHVALATVVGTWGSSPRPVGSKLAVDDTGHMIGSVSGGCVEASVVDAALETIRTGKVALLEFGITDARAWDVGLACGGQIKIFVEPLSSLLNQLLTLGRAGVSVAIATDLKTGAQALVTATDTDTEGNLSLSAPDLITLRDALAGDRNRTLELGDREIFLETWHPPLRLLIIGGVHIAQCLAPLARLAGYEVTLIDPRAAFGAPDRFPETALMNEWPDIALPAMKPDRRTAVVALTHDPKIDDPGLIAALNSDAFYIGALGSRRTHAKRVERLINAGFDPALATRVRGPVGLAIGAITPAEIAISILAEMTAVLRGAALGNRG